MYVFPLDVSQADEDCISQDKAMPFCGQQTSQATVRFSEIVFLVFECKLKKQTRQKREDL